jgi:hypothetical protein
MIRERKLSQHATHNLNLTRKKDTFGFYMRSIYIFGLCACEAGEGRLNNVTTDEVSFKSTRFFFSWLKCVLYFPRFLSYSVLESVYEIQFKLLLFAVKFSFSVILSLRCWKSFHTLFAHWLGGNLLYFLPLAPIPWKLGLFDRVFFSRYG